MRRGALIVSALLMAGPASAFSLFGEVIAEDPTAIRPGETFSIEVTIDTEGDEFSLLEGRFEVVGAELVSAGTICSICPLTQFVAFPEANTVLASLTFANRAGVFRLLRLNLDPPMPSTVRIAVRGDVSELFAQKDTLVGVEDVLRITGRAPLELRSQGTSLGTSLPIVPEPETLVLLAIGLAGLAIRVRPCHEGASHPT